jgi:hypothetical protein
MLKILCENLFNNKILDKVKNFSKFKPMLLTLRPNIYHLTPALLLAHFLHRQTDRQTELNPLNNFFCLIPCPQWSRDPTLGGERQGEGVDDYFRIFSRQANVSDEGR